jgi:hypothetical protein
MGAFLLKSPGQETPRSGRAAAASTARGTTPLTPHLRLSSTPGDATLSSVVTPCCSMAPPTASTATGCRSHRRSPLPELLSLWRAYSGELLDPDALQIESPCSPLTLAPIPHCPHRRNRLRRRRRATMGASPVSQVGCQPMVRQPSYMDLPGSQPK